MFTSKNGTFDPVGEVKPIDFESKSYRRYSVFYAGSSALSLIYTKYLPPSKFHLFGDVPKEMLVFLAGKRFSLKEFYRSDEPVPISQELCAFQENGPQMEYKFVKS